MNTLLSMIASLCTQCNSATLARWMETLFKIVLKQTDGWMRCTTYFEVNKTISKILKWSNMKHLCLSEKGIVVAPDGSQLFRKLHNHKQQRMMTEDTAFPHESSCVLWTVCVFAGIWNKTLNTPSPHSTPHTLTHATLYVYAETRPHTVCNPL